MIGLELVFRTWTSKNRPENTMASLASQLSSRRLARAEARQGHNELRLTVLNLLENDERFAPRLRAFVEDFQRTVAAEELLPAGEALPAEEVEAVVKENTVSNEETRVEHQRLAALAAAAGVAVTKMPPLEDCTRDSAWDKYDGASLESELHVDEELGESAVRLIDARYLIELARQGGIFVRRQDLPEAAFLSLEALKRLPKGGKDADCLRIISVSHPWQHPDQPDPKGLNLKLLARVLKAFVEHASGTYAVFLDVRIRRMHAAPPSSNSDGSRSHIMCAVPFGPPKGADRRSALGAGRCSLYSCVAQHDGLVLAPQYPHPEANRAAAWLSGWLHLSSGHHAQHRELL